MLKLTTADLIDLETHHADLHPAIPPRRSAPLTQTHAAKQPMLPPLPHQQNFYAMPTSAATTTTQGFGFEKR
nr:hypothetical protein CFP56_18574 [Quercus suber]